MTASSMLERDAISLNQFHSVMPALVAGIHVFLVESLQEGMDGRDKPGHDFLAARFDLIASRSSRSIP